MLFRSDNTALLEEIEPWLLRLEQVSELALELLDQIDEDDLRPRSILARMEAIRETNEAVVCDGWIERWIRETIEELAEGRTPSDICFASRLGASRTGAQWASSWTGARRASPSHPTRFSSSWIAAALGRVNTSPSAKRATRYISCRAFLKGRRWARRF